MKKIYLFFIIALAGIGLVSAAWYFVIGGNYRANVASIGSYRDVLVTFNDMSLNTTNGSDASSSYSEFIYNKAGNFTVEIKETFIDNSAGECASGISDCSSKYYLFDGVQFLEINNNQIINLPLYSGKRKLSANMTCVAYSCPQTRDVLIRLHENGVGLV